MGCSKNKIESDILPDTNENYLDKLVPTWENLIDNESTTFDGTNISVRYLGIKNSSALSDPPYIFVGAVFPKSSFANYFDKEVTAPKNSEDLFFNFPNPYIGHMNNPRGFEYLKELKYALRSDEYKSFKSPARPYKFRLANLGSLSYLSKFFPDNERFAKVLEEICKQHFNMDNVKSLTLGEVIFKGFSVSMDIPGKGLFINPPTNIDDLVYIRELTYGASAYFIIASDQRYQDVLNTFKNSFVDAYKKKGGSLNDSQISLLTISDIRQEGIVKTSFADLETFVEDPFESGKQYGYPILCKGCYVKDNSVYIRK